MTMPTANESDLQAEREQLRAMLDSLAEMARKGLPVAEAQAKAQAQLAAVEAHIATLHSHLGAGGETTSINQREQHVNTQVNIAHLYQV
jgi:uncharacterized protein involved in exopolysaccharide biosynthesis